MKEADEVALIAALNRPSHAADGLDPAGERLTEMREVESRMRDVDGDWQFVSFDFAELPATEAGRP